MELLKKILKLFLPKNPTQSIKENWGMKSNSGIEWFLGRRMNWHVDHPNNPDSRSFLENLGFRILGISDEMRYCVEPPKGFTMKKMSANHFNIYNENNEYQFRGFEKMDSDDFRCFLYKK